MARLHSFGVWETATPPRIKHGYRCPSYLNNGSGGTTEVVFERINFTNAIVKSSLERYGKAIESFEDEPHIVRCTPLPSRGSEPP